jgi:DNA-binding response OmpR family regulator
VIIDWGLFYSLQSRRTSVEEARKSMTKVLLAEHDLELLSTYACDLERNGFGIIRAINGKQAISQFVETSPEIIIIDHDLPDSNASEILQKILTIRPQTKAILLTSNREDIVNSEHFGLELFLLKPVSSETIVRSSVALSDLKSRPQLIIVAR